LAINTESLWFNILYSKPLAVLRVSSVLQNHLCVSLCHQWLCVSIFCIPNRLRFSVYPLYYKITSVFLCDISGSVVQYSVFQTACGSPCILCITKSPLCFSVTPVALWFNILYSKPLAVLWVSSVLQNHLCVSLCRKWLCGSIFCILHDSRNSRLTTPPNPLIFPKKQRSPYITV
jgi:hypothetical protein